MENISYDTKRIPNPEFILYLNNIIHHNLEPHNPKHIAQAFVL